MNNYEVKKVIELLEIEKSGEVISEVEDNESRASIRFLSSGDIILIPASGSKGLLIFDKETLDHVLRNGIPINDTSENPAIKYQSLLQHIDTSVGEFISVLERELKISMELNNDSSEYYKTIEVAIKKYGYQNFYDNHSIPFAIFIGEKLRAKFILSWHLKKQYGINPYYVPVLITKTKEEILPDYKLSSFLLEKKNFKMGRFLDGVLWWTRAFEVEKKHNA